MVYLFISNFFNVGVPKEDIFLTTFYVLYFNQQVHIFLQITILYWASEGSFHHSMYCFNSSVFLTCCGHSSFCCTTVFSCLVPVSSNASRVLHKVGFDTPCTQSWEFTEWKTWRINTPSHHGWISEWFIVSWLINL